MPLSRTRKIIYTVAAGATAGLAVGGMGFVSASTTSTPAVTPAVTTTASPGTGTSATP